MQWLHRLVLLTEWLRSCMADSSLISMIWRWSFASGHLLTHAKKIIIAERNFLNSFLKNINDNGMQSSHANHPRNDAPPTYNFSLWVFVLAKVKQIKTQVFYLVHIWRVAILFAIYACEVDFWGLKNLQSFASFCLISMRALWSKIIFQTFPACF